jgi:hypothetical protein
MRTLPDLLAAGALLLSGGLLAQPNVDITLVNNGHDQLEVRLRPDGPFDGIISSISFTLRWQEEFGPALSLIDLVPPQSYYLPVGPSPMVNGGNGYLYRSYAAFPVVTLADLEEAWEQGKEYTICTLDILVPGTEVVLADDAFTGANNRDYYISLNGLDRTGMIFDSAIPPVATKAEVAQDGSMEVRMMPEADFFGWVNGIDLTVRWPANGTTLGLIEQSDALSACIPMEKVGAEITHEGYTYQRFHGEGTNSLAVSQTGWLAEEESVLMRLPILGEIMDPVVANDAWTAANSGNYEIRLNGRPSAGTTDELTTGVASMVTDAAPIFHAEGSDLFVRLPADLKGPVQVNVVNSAGQLIEQLQSASGTEVHLPFATRAPGVHMIQVITEQGVHTYRYLHP